MKHIVNAKNTTVTPAIREYVEKKFEKLGKYVRNGETLDVHTMIEVKDGGRRHKVEVTIPIGKDLVRAEVNNTDMYAAIDEAEKIIARRLRKRKERLQQKYQDKVRPDKVAVVPEVDIDAEDDGDVSDLFVTPEITREKVHKIDAMTREDAAAALEMIGHKFYVYKDIDTGKTCTVYEKEDGTYGHITYNQE